MQRIVTCLGFNSQAEEAVEFYTSVFRSARRLETTRAGEGFPVPQGGVIAASFELDGQEFLAINGGPSFTFTVGMSLLVKCEDQAEVDELWEKLTADGGKPGPCGWLTDRFGVSWQIVPRAFLRMVADRDSRKVTAVMQALQRMTKLDVSALEAAYEQAR